MKKGSKGPALPVVKAEDGFPHLRQMLAGLQDLVTNPNFNAN
jgi:hypothetical protein